MATLQDVGASLEAIHKDLQQGQAYLTSYVQASRQWMNFMNSAMENTASTGYVQVQALIESATRHTEKSIAVMQQADQLLLQWIRKRIGNTGNQTGTSTASETRSFFVDAQDLTAVEEKEESPKLSPEEVASRWALVQKTTEEILQSYKEALLQRVSPDEPLIRKFLGQQRRDMLDYEAALLEEASGNGSVKEQDVYTYALAGADGKYSFDALAKKYGTFCLNEASNWIQEINPNYYNPYILPSQNPYHINCGSCAFAVETRLSGGDDLVATQNNIKTDFAMEAATGKQCVYMSVQDIETVLREKGAGSHLIVGINRSPTPTGVPQAGHWFNAFFDGENFYTLDGQSGEILDWPYDYGSVSAWCALI